MKDRMFVIPGTFVPYNDTVTILSYKRLRGLDLDMDVFAFHGSEDPSLKKELEKDEAFRKFHITYTSELDWAIPRNFPLRLPVQPGRHSHCPGRLADGRGLLCQVSD